MPVRLFHRSDPEVIPAILTGGFRDGEDGGVWFSRHLDDWGAAGAWPIEVIVEMTEDELAAFAVVVFADEEFDETTGEFVKLADDDEIERFTWYKIPAAVINPIARSRQLSIEEHRRLTL